MKLFPLEEWQTEQIVFELQHEPAFALWDQAGFLMEQINQVTPMTKLREAAPGVVHVAASDGPMVNKLEVKVELERTSVRVFVAEREERKHFHTLVESVTNTLRRALAVESFSRVGLRHIRILEHKKPEEAAEAMLALGIIKPPADGRFGVRTSCPASLDFGVRWESESLGARCVLSNTILQIAVEVDSVHSRFLKPTKKSIPLVRLDLDYYTRRPMDAFALNPVEWISRVEHVARRDLPKYLQPQGTGE